MDLQTALSSTRSPDFKGLLFPGTRDIGPDSLSGDDRFGEYLRRALGNDGTVSTDPPKQREAAENGCTEEHTARSEDTDAREADAETVRRDSREEPASEKGTEKSAEKESPSADAKTGASDESGKKNPKRSEDASEDTKVKREKEGGLEKSPVAEGAENRKSLDESADTADADEETENTGEASARRTLARESAASAEKAEGKAPEASAFMSRGEKSESARTEGELQESGRLGGSETARKTGTADTGHAGGGDAENKNTRDHKEPSFTVVDLRTGRSREGAKHRAERTEGSSHESSQAGKETFKGSVDRAVIGEERSADSVRLVRAEGESTIEREFSEKSPTKSGLSRDQQALIRNMR
ncbi:MAG: hypothetical protein ACLFRY_14490, partial [Spirochaetia bacterium]